MRHSTRDPQRLSRGCIIIEAALEYFISILVTGAFLARITQSLGFLDSLTGILSSFVSLGCVFQLGAIGLFRKTVRVRRAVLICQICNQLFFAGVYLTPVIHGSAQIKTGLFLLFFVSAYVLFNLYRPPKSGWLISLIPDDTRGRFTAILEMVSLLGGMAFTYAAGVAIDHLEAAGNQRMSFILGAVAIVVLMLLHTASLLPVQQTSGKRTEESVSVKNLLSNRMYCLVVPVILLWNVANGCATPFYGAYQIKELGFSMTFVSFLSIVYSVVRMAASPFLGRMADRHSFARMVTLCFAIAAAGFAVNCFTIPQNGKAFFGLYMVLHAVSMAGINSSLTNLIYDYVKGESRRNALAISSALGGMLGFGSTCLMSPLVNAIQQNGNRLAGIHVYPAQAVSAIALVITLVLIVYLLTVVIPFASKAKKKG